MRSVVRHAGSVVCLQQPPAKLSLAGWAKKSVTSVVIKRLPRGMPLLREE